MDLTVLTTISHDVKLDPQVRRFAQQMISAGSTSIGREFQETFQRAALTYANLVANGGALQVHQLKAWWNLTLGVDPIDKASVFNLIDTAPFNGVNGDRYDYFETGDDEDLVAHAENTETAGSYVEETTGYVTILPTRVKMLYRPTYERLKQAVVADPTGQLLLAVMSVRFRNSTANLYWNGNSDSTTAFYAIKDGMCTMMRRETTYPDYNRDADSDTEWAAITTTPAGILDIMDRIILNAATYKDGTLLEKPGFVWMMSKRNRIFYQNALRDLGSNVLESGASRYQKTGPFDPESGHGFPVLGVNYFSSNVIALVQPMNLPFRYNESPDSFLIEADRNIDAQRILFVMSADFGWRPGWQKSTFVSYHTDNILT